MTADKFEVIYAFKFEPEIIERQQIARGSFTTPNECRLSRLILPEVEDCFVHELVAGRYVIVTDQWLSDIVTVREGGAFAVDLVACGADPEHLRCPAGTEVYLRVRNVLKTDSLVTDEESRRFWRPLIAIHTFDL